MTREPTTAEARLVAGPAGPLGWRDLVTAPGQAHVGARPDGDVLTAFVHVSDLHVCDAESPARQEHLDHHGDPGAPYAGRLGTIGTYRPQEILTVQVVQAALTAVRRLDRAPVTGAPLDAVLATGDATDNAQRNELAWYATLMAGGSVTPGSGHPGRSSWVGAPDAGGWWPHFWHPDGAADGEQPDVPTARFGYPVVPGLVEAARRTVVSAGVGLPWYGVHGNHDALLQGTVAPTAATRRLATGGRRVVDLAARQTPLVVLQATARTGPARYTHDATSPWVPVPPDAGRALVDPGEFDAAHARAGAAQHGPGVVSRRGNAWAADIGRVRVVAVDTVNPYGGWEGSVDAEQLGWLEERLVEARDGYVVIASHHPSWTLTNSYHPDGARRGLADDVLALLARHPCVVAWVAGHVHAHTSLWHPAPGRAGGLWELTTASLVDWPQQLRVLELVRERGGTLALASTVLDHAAPTAWDREALGEPTGLAAVSRVLAANDYRARSRPGLLAAAAGRPEDRNVVWRLPDPHA